MIRLIERSIDVEAPVAAVYRQWRLWEDFPRFLDGIVAVQQGDDRWLLRRVRIGRVERDWPAVFPEPPPAAPGSASVTMSVARWGVVSFGRRGDGLTRVKVRLQYEREDSGHGTAFAAVWHRVDQALGAFKGSLETWRAAAR